LSVFKRPGQSVYSYDFRYRGARFSGTTPCTTKREAERFEEEVRNAAKAKVVDGRKPMTFAVAASRYFDEVGQFHRNLIETERHLEWLSAKIGKATKISAITDSVIASVVARRRGEGVGPATVNRTVCEPLRAILKRCGETWGQEVPRVQWKTHFLKEPQERIREASPDEEKALLAAIRGDYAPALRFALISGCRRAEIVSLEWTAVDFFHKEITIHGKGDRKRVIPMTKDMYALLKQEHGNDHVRVFTYRAKRPSSRIRVGDRMPITMEGFKTEWKRARDRSGVANFRFHDTRHTAATRILRKSGNLKHAQMLLGHSTIATTSRYAHVKKDDLRAAMEAVSAAEITTDQNSEREIDSENKGEVL